MAFVERQASTSKGGNKPKGGGKNDQQRLKSNALRRKQLNDELADLQKRVNTFAPQGSIEDFNELPLSKQTLRGLKSSHFVKPTPIQALAIPPALKGQDILGSAKTGSGKTLAFLVPMLERLHQLKWGKLDGLGAVVISPTRELAVQTFKQLCDIGKFHNNLSAGLVIGGKDLKGEKDRLARMNILIATPGRLLQHLDTTFGFESSNLKVLILDEADRLLDMGFQSALREIVAHFKPSVGPDGRPDRQTMLFSATQSKDVAALARLSLYEPLYINCNKPGEEGVLPAQLKQYYSIVPLHRKLDALWGFIKRNLQMKGVVFVTTTKQVRFIFETFKRLHPGLPLVHLHGKQKQATRLEIFQKFSKAKASLLICTDIAARGLDFPAVNWVIQLDCPEDVDTYIHRVGRTARYQSDGQSLLFLLPSEQEGMEARWKEKSIEPTKMRIRESAMGDLKQQMQNFAFREQEIKYLGQRAFISYMKSVYLQKDKTVFKVKELPAEEYAASMGLPGAPQIKFEEGKKAKIRSAPKAVEQQPKEEDLDAMVAGSDEDDDEGDVDDEDEEASDGEPSGDDDDDDDGEDAEEEEEDASEESGSDDEEQPRSKSAPVVRTKYDRMFERKNQSVLTPHYSALISHGDAEDDADDVFTLARRNHDIDQDDADGVDGEVQTALTSKTPAKSTDEAVEKPLIAADDLSKRKQKLATTRKGQLKTRPGPEKVVFDEEGQQTTFYQAGLDAESGAAQQRDEFVKEERERMKEADKVDREVARERRREKKRKRKEREREAMAMGYDSEEGGPMAVLGGGDYDDGGSDDEHGGPRSDGDDASTVAYKPSKKQRKGKEEELQDEEALALKLLQG